MLVLPLFKVYWWRLAPDGTTRHSYFSLEQMLETGQSQARFGSWCHVTSLAHIRYSHTNDLKVRCNIEQVKKGMDHQPILQYAHGLYHDLGLKDLTVETDEA
ncbi:Hypothetical predicted protein [Olea europaea subsp. europaea]|uniref:Uncharacterized protein n=1 Tax=Olea europaea subsp. europaea TaxID=158383 RepID=A0A8S0PLI8_OLEEU|nr:Hypothetical predicted protein [Olea europaea subsp. europaea]